MPWGSEETLMATQQVSADLKAAPTMASMSLDTGNVPLAALLSQETSKPLFPGIDVS